MRPQPSPPDTPLVRLADGTVKQVNPFTGTRVWTVPGRGDRPIAMAATGVTEVDPQQPDAHCAFCETRLTETTPEKSRVVLTGDGAPEFVDELAPEHLRDTAAAFRLFGNLFEIVSLDYWKSVHGYRIPERAAAHQRAYLASAAGRAHVRKLVAVRVAAAHGDPATAATMDDDQLARWSESFFGGCHDVVVARRHLEAGATTSDQHASSGTLTPAEHSAFVAFTVRAAEGLYRDNPHAAYVSVFQNWLRPAGASFDHLHKQLVAIDELPVGAVREQAALGSDPDLYNRHGIGLSVDEGLVVAANEHAVAVVGVGHRYPSLVVWSTSPACEPWRHTAAELRGFSDLLHACHAATGPLVPCNEEWHHRPRGVAAPMPWRVVLKWRISTPAGFEGATGVYVNTIDPWALRARVVPRLHELRAAGTIADLRIGDECSLDPAPLRYREDRA